MGHPILPFVGQAQPLEVLGSAAAQPGAAGELLHDQRGGEALRWAAGSEPRAKSPGHGNADDMNIFKSQELGTDGISVLGKFYLSKCCLWERMRFKSRFSHDSLRIAHPLLSRAAMCVFFLNYDCVLLSNKERKESEGIRGI